MRRRGFTLLELLIGMVITAMVLTALATVTYAVSVNWKTAEAVEASYMAGAQVNARLGQHLRSAATLGAIRNGTLNGNGSSAALFFWKGDDTSTAHPNGDGNIQYAEIALLEHDIASEELRLYTVTDFDTWSTAAKTAADAIAGSAYINAASNMNDFKGACVGHRVLLRNVTGMILKKYTTGTPTVEFLVNIRRPDGSIGPYYGTIVLRASLTPSN